MFATKYFPRKPTGVTIFSCQPIAERSNPPKLPRKWRKVLSRCPLLVFFLSGNLLNKESFFVGICRGGSCNCLEFFRFIHVGCATTPKIGIKRVKELRELKPFPRKTRWWFQIFFIFTPTWGRFPIWRAYFSQGLKPPTIGFFSKVAAGLLLKASTAATPHRNNAKRNPPPCLVSWDESRSEFVELGCLLFWRKNAELFSFLFSIISYHFSDNISIKKMGRCQAFNPFMGFPQVGWWHY